MKKLKQKIKDILTGLMNFYLSIVWCILLPFICLFELLFGGSKK